MKAGDTLGGKYKLIQRLGKGGMGVVWEANHELTGRKVALKLILDPTDDLRVRLRREARACGSLNHPNIVEVYDVSETAEGEPFLVMQFLPGMTLGEMLDKKRRIEPPAVAARIARDIASALEAAHGAQIIHRDLKPANIFLRQDSVTDEGAFTVKVLDFGVSKFLSGDEGPGTMTNMVPGTPSYMSPEQARMEKGLDHRTDIWSLGVILYEMLTGTRPFLGKSVQDVVHQIHTAPIPSVLSKVRGVPPALDAIVMRCLERDRDKRMPDAATLTRALTALAEATASRVLVNLVAPPSSSPVRNSMNSTPDGGSATTGRPSAVSTFDSSPTSVMGRPGFGPGSGNASTVDPLATPPFLRQGAASIPDQRPRGIAGAGEQIASPDPSSFKTQVLAADGPIASPMPAWRLEMQQALAASHPGSETRGASSADLLEQGGTLAIPLEMVHASARAPGREPGMTTTTSPIVNPSNSGALTNSASSLKRKRGNGSWLYAAIGVGVLSVVALAAVIVVGLSPHGSTADGAVAGSASAEQAAAPEQTVPPPLPSMQAKEAPPPAQTGAASPPVAPSASAAPVVPKNAPVSPPARLADAPVLARSTGANSPNAPTKPQTLPPCTRFVKVGCR